MAFSIFTGRKKVMNLVINDHSIRYIEVKQRNPIVIAAKGERLLPAGIISEGKIQDIETLSLILDECIADWGIKNREVRFLVPDSLVIIRKVSIPVDVKEDEIHGFLYLEFGSSIHLPFDEPVFDTVPLSLEKNKREILLVAAPEEYVLEYTNLLKGASLKPVAADISPLASYRLYHFLGLVEEKETLMTIQFDIGVVSMCIFEGTFPIFMRHIPVEIQSNWEVQLGRAKTEEMSFAGNANEFVFQFEDIYKEIDKLLEFYRYSLTHGKNSITKILVNGDHPRMTTIINEMSRRFEIQVATIETSLPEAAFGVSREYHLALGLGLKEG
ncbi:MULTISPECIES: type IV pilus biogenesis protein PilM [Mesobacillus]|nr:MULTISPECIES: pilus assembly protein PilM [Mesobacillus]MDQ0414179.1 type IV pilus assembly protein PilM [Mesobacillus stamsii]